MVNVDQQGASSVYKYEVVLTKYLDVDSSQAQIYPSLAPVLLHGLHNTSHVSAVDGTALCSFVGSLAQWDMKRALQLPYGTGI